jgi:cytochrome c-type biogenesis protein CcmH/NrfG
MNKSEKHQTFFYGENRREPAGRSFWTGILPALVLGLLFAASAGPRNFSSSLDPFEPSVSREENVLLDRVMKTAETDPERAIQMLEEERSGEASPALDFALGNLYFQGDNLESARKAYRTAIEKLPKFRSALMNLGRVYLLLDRPGQTIDLYRKLVADGQADADILLLLGHALLLENAPVSAESAYRQTLLLRPGDADAILGLAKALMRQERYAEGLALVGEILEHDSTNRELWSLQANAYLSMGKYADAVQTIEKARRLGCADAEMIAVLGDLYLNRDQPEDALRAYKQAFRGESPSIRRVLRAVEGFLIVGDLDGAKEMIGRADAAADSMPGAFDRALQTDLLRLKAGHARQTGRLEDAAALCKEVLRLDPLDGRTLLILAELHREADRLEDAVMACERASRIQGFEADALILQGRIEAERERYARAVELLEAAQSFEDRPYVARYLEQLRRMLR